MTNPTVQRRHVMAGMGAVFMAASTGRAIASPSPDDFRRRLAQSKSLILQGVEFLKKQDRDGALDLFQKSIVESPDLPTGHFYLAVAWERKGDAARALAAYQKALELKPDLVILDINMPVLGGFGAAKELHRIMPDVPILFFTMNESGQFIREAKLIGVQGFVAKDRAGTVLLQAVDALLRNETFFPPFQI